jgi:hypothetical protein
LRGLRRSQPPRPRLANDARGQQASSASGKPSRQTSAGKIMTRAPLPRLRQFINHVLSGTSSPAGLTVFGTGATYVGALRPTQTCQVRRTSHRVQAGIAVQDLFAEPQDRQGAVKAEDLCGGCAMPSVNGYAIHSPRARALADFPAHNRVAGNVPFTFSILEPRRARGIAAMIAGTVVPLQGHVRLRMECG